ncbi:MAG TPA: hypothetical protein VK536_09825 [Candidatus Limnocylindrales bacterium]|nr:hypothetical protein [Candidatus Limnocylindrales bacterium]
MQRKYKIIVAIIAACLMSIAMVAAVSPYFSSYTRNFTWTQYTIPFELDVNGTQQTSQVVNVFPYFVNPTDQYCEVYTLINDGNSPIIITASVSGTGATPNWMSNNVAYLAPGQTTAMAIYFTSFTNAGTNTVTFNSAVAFPGATLVTSYNVQETGDADSGQGPLNGGYWSLDSFTQNIQIYHMSGDVGNNYVAFVDYVGSWNTFEGVSSPSASVDNPSRATEGASASGPMLFSYAATFNYAGSTFPTNGATLVESGGGTATGPAPYTITPGVTPYHWYADTAFGGNGNTGGLTVTEIDTGGAGEQALYVYSPSSTSLDPALQSNNAQIWTGFGSGHGDIVVP